MNSTKFLGTALLLAVFVLVSSSGVRAQGSDNSDENEIFITSVPSLAEAGASASFGNVVLVGLEVGSASGAVEMLEEVSFFGFDYRGVDLAWDGEYLWATDANEDKIYKLDTSGNIISSFGSPAIVSYGLAWDGEHLWATSTTRNRVYKVDTSGNLISSFGVDSDLPYGLAWDGEHLWVSDVAEGRIYSLRIVTYYSLSTYADPSRGGSVTLGPLGRITRTARRSS